MTQVRRAGRRGSAVLAALALASSVSPQTASQAASKTAVRPVYVESFRKRPVKIEEASFEVSLDAKTSSYQRQIKDADGKERYKLAFTPMRAAPGDDRIISWRVTLADNKHPVYGDLLLPSQDPDLNQTAAGHVAQLDANPYALVPLMAGRVIKVDEFYCVLQVEKYHLLVPERSYVDSMTVEVKFANTNPLSVAGDN